MTADRSPERLARAGLCRVVEQGDPDAHRMFAGLPMLEAWDRLRSGDVRMGRWLEAMEQADPQRDLDHASALGIRFVIPGDDEWPIQLEDLATAGQFGRRGDTPYGLWVRGEASLQRILARSVTVVGARACSSYGTHLTSDLAAGLADHGVTVVSGGAYGVDAAAHRGALATERGVTVAFLASGVDVHYPRGNTTLFDRIAENGLLVSERPPGSAPTKTRFFARNRLIAASSLGTVVIEAARRSGSLNTAAWAEACRRPVFAVPGPITSGMSAGTNQLIRERKADLITDVDQILDAVSSCSELPAAAEHNAVRDLARHSEHHAEQTGPGRADQGGRWRGSRLTPHRAMHRTRGTDGADALGMVRAVESIESDRRTRARTMKPLTTPEHPVDHPMGDMVGNLVGTVVGHVAGKVVGPVPARSNVGCRSRRPGADGPTAGPPAASALPALARAGRGRCLDGRVKARGKGRVDGRADDG